MHRVALSLALTAVFALVFWSSMGTSPRADEPKVIVPKPGAEINTAPQGCGERER